jgi:hypothetical protein
MSIISSVVTPKNYSVGRVRVLNRGKEDGKGETNITLHLLGMSHTTASNQIRSNDFFPRGDLRNLVRHAHVLLAVMTKVQG